MEPKPNREQVLKRSSIEIRVVRAGMFQRLPFKIEREPYPTGAVPFLASDRFIDLPELVRIAEEYGLPVKARNGKVFPKGKGAHDFSGL